MCCAALRRAAGRAAWLRFSDLTRARLGPPDAIAVARAFDTLLLSDVPAMSRWDLAALFFF